MTKQLTYYVGTLDVPADGPAGYLDAGRVLAGYVGTDGAIAARTGDDYADRRNAARYTDRDAAVAAATAAARPGMIPGASRLRARELR